MKLRILAQRSRQQRSCGHRPWAEASEKGRKRSETPPTALGLAGTWRPSLSSHTLAWDTVLHPGPQAGGRELVTHSGMGQAGSFVCSSPEQRSKPVRAMDEGRYSNGSGTSPARPRAGDRRENHILKHTALPALLRLGWLWGAKGPQAQALHRTARGCKSDCGT